MTVVNKAFIAECLKFLTKEADSAIRGDILEVTGIIPNGPKYAITTEMNKHTKIGKYSIQILVDGARYDVFKSQYRQGDTSLKLSMLEQTEFEQYLSYGIYNAVHHDSEFDEKLMNMLTGATHEISVKHFSGIEVKYHREDDSHRVMVSLGADVYYALEEAVYIQDGFSATSLTTPEVLDNKINSIIGDWLQTFTVPDFEHTFN